MAPAKQDPAGKAIRGMRVAGDGKVYLSYAQIHALVDSMVPEIEAYRPDVIVAIGGGGFIPARMLRTQLRVPILAVSLELYDDATNTARKTVQKVQWFDETSGVGHSVEGRRVLVVDEVDDTRTTLDYCVRELREKNRPSEIAVCVVLNKLKRKKGALPPDVAYFAGAELEDKWCAFPWDARAYGGDIYEHERKAGRLAGGWRRLVPVLLLGAALGYLAARR